MNALKTEIGEDRTLQRLQALGISLPEPPGRAGLYTQCRLFGENMVYLSGCAPKQIFAFRPEPSAIASAGSLSESFLLTVTGLDTTRLDFYKKMSKQEDI